MEFNIEKNTILLVLSGSHAYGMSRPESDVDVRGLAIPPKDFFFGYSKRFEQFDGEFPRENIINKVEELVKRKVPSEEKIDSCVYNLTKFFSLASQGNPNLLDILYADESCRILSTPLAEILLENKDLFLSTKLRFSYAGYAMSQLKRINTHRQYLLNPPTHKPTRAEFNLPEHSVMPRDQLLAAESLIKKKIEDWLGSQEELPREVLEDIRTRTTSAITDIWSALTDGCWRVEKKDFGYAIKKPESPVKNNELNEEVISHAAGKLLGYDENFLDLLARERGYRSAMKQYKQYEEWKLNRNPARAELEKNYGFDGKHASHLVRLMRMCKEIMEDGKVIVKRPDAEELLAIRNGAWTYEELITWAEKQDKELTEFYNSSKSPLPKKPDTNKLDKLCMEIVELFLKG